MMGRALELDTAEPGPLPGRGNGLLDQHAANAAAAPGRGHGDPEARDVAVALPSARPHIKHAHDFVAVRRDKDQGALVGFSPGDEGALFLFGRRRPAADGAQMLRLQRRDISRHGGCITANRGPDDDLAAGHGDYGLASAGAGRQTSRRFSTRVTMTSITITKAASTNMPANTPATSNTPSACWIR